MTYDRSRMIVPPFTGWDNSLPAAFLPHNSFKQITGWLLNKGRIQSFPDFLVLSNPPNGEVISNAATFEDQLGNLHTGVITQDRAYYLNGSGYLDQGAITPTQNQPFAVEVYLNRMFFVNGIGVLRWLDGSQGIQNNSDSPGSSLFLGKLSGSLFQFNLFESNQRFPLSLRWSAINNHLEWNPAVDPTAGSALIPEVEDEITGVSGAIRGNIAIYRTHGISILTDTGSIPRFSITNFESGPTGVGVFYEYTLANWGDISAFVAEDDVYLFSLSGPTPIGGKAKKSILKDLNSSSGRPYACLIGSLGGGIDYKSYWLSIPVSNNTIDSVWVFHFDDQSWVNLQLPFSALNWMGNVVVS